MTQLSFDDASRKRSLGMERAAASAEKEWQAEARGALRAYLETHEFFHCDAFWDESGLRWPANGRSLGPVIVAAAKAGWMEKTERALPSVRSNRSIKPVWRSRIYRGARAVA